MEGAGMIRAAVGGVLRPGSSIEAATTHRARAAAVAGPVSNHESRGMDRCGRGVPAPNNRR